MDSQSVVFPSTTDSITVIIPTIPERSDLLQRALASVAAQTLQPDRVEVVVARQNDDAPTVKQRGLMASQTTWTAFLDDDDEFTPNHLETLLDAAKMSGADLIYPWFELIDADGKVVNPQPLLCYYDDPVLGRISAEGVAWGTELHDWTMEAGNGNVIITGVLMRTEIARRVGGYTQRDDPDWPEFPWEELGLWRRMLAAGAVFYHSPHRTYRWHRTHGGNTGGRSDLRKQVYGVR